LCSFFIVGNIRAVDVLLLTMMRNKTRMAIQRIILCASVLAIAGWAAGCGFGGTSAATRGRELFQNCTPCHQEDGSGNAEIGAPNIAGMKAWYVQEELDKFRSGLRGAHFADVEGLRMRPIALSLGSEDDIKLVSQYVETMPVIRHAPTLPGDAQAGKALFATCAACHGETGAGNADLKVPSLAIEDDWYLVREIRKFRSGVRGTNPKDTEGQLMRPMARALHDEDAIRNVIAYVETLKP
jgi:cytochrome c553